MQIQYQGQNRKLLVIDDQTNDKSVFDSSDIDDKILA